MMNEVYIKEKGGVERVTFGSKANDNRRGWLRGVTKSSPPKPYRRGTSRGAFLNEHGYVCVEARGRYWRYLSVVVKCIQQDHVAVNF